MVERSQYPEVKRDWRSPLAEVSCALGLVALVGKLKVWDSLGRPLRHVPRVEMPHCDQKAPWQNTHSNLASTWYPLTLRIIIIAQEQ